MYLFYGAVALIVIAIALFWQSSRARKSSGLPAGRVIYTDMRNWGSKVERPLYDAALGLAGKPDYLVQSNGVMIPVEVKSGRAPQAPYDSHIYQLASYCLLVESHYGKRPPYGIIHYEDKNFAVDYTSELEQSLREVLDDMRKDERRHDVARSHEMPARCAGCGYRNVCPQKL